MHRGRWSCVASAPVHKNPARLQKFLSQDHGHLLDFTGFQYITETTPTPQPRRKPHGIYWRAYEGAINWNAK